MTVVVFTLKEIDRVRYRPSKESEDQLGEIRNALGVPDKATMARLSVARSLIDMDDIAVHAVAALAGNLPGAGLSEKGSAIEGIHLFGSDTDLWSCMIAAAAPEAILDQASFRYFIEYHWNRGAALLGADFRACNRDVVNFVVQLAGRLNMQGGDSKSASGAATKVISELVQLIALTDGPVWGLNNSGGNGLLVISGRPGSGKSQVALDLLAQAASRGVRFLFFDLKGELEESSDSASQQQKREQFLRQTKADYVRLISSSLPINPLVRGLGDADRAQIASEFAHLVKCFASQLGPNQERILREAYESLENPDLTGLVLELEARGEDGVVYSVCQKLESFRIFSNANDCETIDSWLQRSKVIDFKPLGNDNETKALVVAFILNSIMRRLNRQLPVSNGIQPIQMILFVDEAHLLLPKEGKAGLLGSLARQGRSWGFPVWLASQDADAFVTKGQHATDFSELADCGLHLSPEVLSETQQKHILGQVFHKPIAQGFGVFRLKGRTSVGAVRQFWRDKGVPPTVPMSER